MTIGEMAAEAAGAVVLGHVASALFAGAGVALWDGTTR